MDITKNFRDARERASGAADRARRTAAGERSGPGWLGAALLAGVAAVGGAVAAWLADPQRGRGRRAQLADQGMATARRVVRRGERAARSIGANASAAVRSAQHARGPGGTGATDDVTLAARAETELFRDPDVPKGSINLNAERGVLVLRGQVPDAGMRDRLGEQAEKVDGAWSVQNLLTVEGEEVGAARRG